jgi:hypothetical protein
MNEAKHDHGGSNNDNGHQRHAPYWKRAHHDWGYWVAAVLIFTAMIIYVTTVEFSLAPRRPPSPTLLAPVGK